MGRRRSETYYEDIGPDFDRFMSSYDVAQRAQLIASLLQGSYFDYGLEVGCGTGAITRGLLPSVRRLVASDISNVLAEGVGKRLSIEYRQADAVALPFDDSTFDLVVSSECIEHTPDPVAAIREMVRVCRVGGVVVLTSPNMLWYPVVRLAQITHLRKFQGNERFLWPRQMISAGTHSGALLEQISGCHLLPWQLPFAKPVLRRLDKHGPFLYPTMINIGLRLRRVR